MKPETYVYWIGILFAWGLGVSGMTRPPKILGFLNVLGDWDPTLLVVLVAATSVYAIGYFFLIPRTIKEEVDASLSGKEKLQLYPLVGAAIFGIGWGMVGLCPGPALVDLASGSGKVVLFVVGMVLGTYAMKAYQGPPGTASR